MLRLALIVLGLVTTMSPAAASIWEWPDWALTSNLSGSTGYDSDLTLSNGGPGDFFVQASPSLSLLRKNSSSDIEFTGNLSSTDFLDNKEPQHTAARYVLLSLLPGGFSAPCAATSARAPRHLRLTFTLATTPYTSVAFGRTEAGLWAFGPIFPGPIGPRKITMLSA